MGMTAWCAACLRFEPVDGNWRTLWIDHEGDLRIGSAGSFDLGHGRPDAVVVCGEGTALALTERYLHGGSFAAAHDLHLGLMARLDVAAMAEDL